MIVGDELPQLRQLLWSREDAEISEEEAFSLYGANRAWVRPSEMSEHERRFLDELVRKYGRGVFLG